MKTEFSLSNTWHFLKKCFSFSEKPMSFHLMVFLSYFLLIAGNVLHQKWMQEAYLPFTEFIQKQATDAWATYVFPKHTYVYIGLLLLFSVINVFFVLYTFSTLVQQEKTSLVKSEVKSESILVDLFVSKTNLFWLCFKKIPVAMLYVLLANFVSLFSLYFSDLFQLIFELFYSFVLLFVLEGQKFTFSFTLSRHLSARNRSFYFLLLTIFYILNKILLYALVSLGHISLIWLLLLFFITYLKYAKLAFLAFHFSSFFFVIKMDKNDLLSN